MMTAAAFIHAETMLLTPPLVPEIELHLARASRDIFRAAEQYERTDERWPPYWAFAWPGGQGLARFILDNASLVAGRQVADVGAGSGLAAIAAMKAGAAGAVAIDPDPLSWAVIRMNAAQNGVAVDAVLEDPLGSTPSTDLILIGDLVYEPELETRVTAFLEAAVKQGTSVLFADRTTARRPKLNFVLQAEYTSPLVPALEDTHIEHSRVWLLDASNVPKGRKRARR